MNFYQYAALTHQGKVRENNEDNFYIDGFWKKDITKNVFGVTGEFYGEYFLASVFDGMGGQELGEVASRIGAVCLNEYLLDRFFPKRIKYEDSKKKKLSLFLHKFVRRIEDVFGNDCEENGKVRLKQDADGIKKNDLRLCRINGSLLSDNPMDYIDFANQQICKEITRKNVHMGTTISLLEFSEKGAVAINLGDSPIFQYRGDLLQEIYTRHSPVGSLVRDGLITNDEARVHPLKNRVDQYLGMDPEEMILVPAITEPIHLVKGDQFLICTDGLTDMLRNEDIKDILKRPYSIKTKAKNLVQKAIDNGGLDNVSVVLIEIMNTQ